MTPTPEPRLRSIKAEAAACRKAWADHPYDPDKPTLAWHLHHESLAEFLTEPAGHRIAYILSYKPKREQALRLPLFRPVVEPVGDAAYDEAWAAYVKARAAYAKARAAEDKALAAYVKARAAEDKAWVAYVKALEPHHASQCPDCPWDGHSIFGDAA